MAPKRTTRANSVLPMLVHVKTGHMITIPDNGELTFGRSTDNLWVVDGPFISHHHSAFKYIEGQYFIADLYSSAGTFLNHEKLDGGRRNFKVLNHGDLISFGCALKSDYIYKFCYPPNKDKRHRSDMKKLQNASLKLNCQRQSYKKTLTVLHSKISSIKTEHTELNKSVREQMAAIETLINTAQSQTVVFDKKRKSELADQLFDKFVITDNVNKLKKDLIYVVESEFQCNICSDAMIKVRVSNCHHSFCEKCFLMWMRKDIHCPICRTVIQYSTNCIAIDNFLGSFYELIGGNPKKIRDEIVDNTVKTPGSRKKQVNSTATRLMLANARGNNHAIVDLTSTSK